MMHKGDNGATLMETVVALGMFVIIAAAGTSLLIHASDTGGRIAQKSELLENARITLDFMINQIRLSEEYQTNPSNGVMNEIIVVYYDPEYNDNVTHTFLFDRTNGIVTFGGQRLAGYIDSVLLETSDDCLKITILTKNKISDITDTIEPVKLIGKINLKNKKGGS